MRLIFVGMMCLFVASALIVFVPMLFVNASPSFTTEHQPLRRSSGYPDDWTDWQLDLELLRNGATIAGMEEPVRRAEGEFSWFTDFYPGVPLKDVAETLEQAYWPDNVFLDSLHRDSTPPIPHRSPSSQMYWGYIHWRDEDGAVYHLPLYVEIDGLDDPPRQFTFGELLCMAEAADGDSLTLETCRVRWSRFCQIDDSGPEGLCGDEACEWATLRPL